ncbi:MULTISPECIES: ubiquitin-like domain-containing protein [unclassified Streptomyces]|uniref:ubiquitin-like domain-containing protein n=1 Tax=unclassified Streptomyces TaxID=2593676 RepID=UPI002B1CC93C|nr:MULTISPECIES: ubiquitin-like domain-containing protein [unclassified Streptomyces]
MSESPFTGLYGDEAAPDPEPAVVPAPRTGDRRAARRRRSAEAGPAPAVPPAPTGRRRAAPAAGADLAAPAGPGTGRRRSPDPGPRGPGAATGPGQGPALGAGTGVHSVPAGTGRRRRTTPAETAAGRDAWRRIVPQALVVAFLAGGTTAFVAADKSVRLTVDGEPRTLHTFADDVDELLAAEGVGVGPHDLVAPARGEALDDGDEIVVRYGRPVRLTLDGQSRQVWTTAGTVEGALRQFGIRVEGASLSAPRTAPVPRAGLTLAVRTERSVTFMADGRESTIRTNAATVQEALGQAGITLQGQDTTSVPPASFPRDGQTVTVLRITGTREVREERIPYETERTEDDDLFAGTEVVERAGRPGARRVTYALRTVNGVRQKPRKVAEEIVREPVTQLVTVGTKPLPTSVSGADGLDWGALAQCESGGRPAATDASGTYGGLYQFDVRTWQSLGGSGRPQDAPGPEQTYRAKKLYVQRGATPWPHCGRRLYRG